MNSLKDLVIKLANGNPGALTFILNTLENDMDVLLKLDSASLYGENIYMLWNDCCDRDTNKTIRMIKKLSIAELRSYVVDKDYGTKYEEVLKNE